jgi:hypothetical protein
MTRFEKCRGIYTGKGLAKKIASANRKEGDRVGSGPSTETGCGGIIICIYLCA